MTMTYKGYAARIEYDDADEVFVGHIAGINDVVGFHADTVEGLRTAFGDAVDDYLAACAELGKAPEKSYSGNLMLRIDPVIHGKAARAAELAGKSLNEWSAEALDRMATHAPRP